MRSETKIRSPLKWPGGKYQILDRICDQLPPGDRLIEPFAGSGVVFLNTSYKRYLLNDINKDLISFFKITKREGDEFIAYAKKLFTAKNNSEKVYYRFREQFNTTDDPRRKAALLLYINKHGYNGLIRYNASGGLNVPFGRYKKPYFPEKELRHFITKSKRAAFQNKDFETIMRNAKKGDVIYCDPPYVPLTQTANFTTYSAGGFSMDDQLRLVAVAEETAKRGIPVLISNHYTPFTAEAYMNAELHTFQVRRMISRNGNQRNKAAEVLAVYR